MGGAVVLVVVLAAVPPVVLVGAPPTNAVVVGWLTASDEPQSASVNSSPVAATETMERRNRCVSTT
jgi:hypothetical protein